MFLMPVSDVKISSSNLNIKLSGDSYNVIQRVYEMRRYLVSNDTISAVPKFNKYETCQPKITTLLTDKKQNNIVLFDTKYFFI